MDYIKIRFGDGFTKVGSEIQQTIEDMFRSINPIYTIAERSWKPQVDMYETPDEVVVVAEISGVRKEDLEVEINSRAVRIFGIRSEAPRIDNARYRLAEIQYGSFERILGLPAQIDPEVVSASYTDGFLTIRLARLQLNKTYRIPVEGH
ncbi:MAG: Hsp20/alpha crystallin family protein [Desulfobacterales bacterium]